MEDGQGFAYGLGSIIFSCTEPRITLQIAEELDQWFFFACSVAGHDWDPMDEHKEPVHVVRRHGGSGMVRFEDLAHVAFVPLDGLPFPKG